MKLISCHIDGFGSIIDRDIEFNESLNIFCENNGYGKSTISAFLKAMFYGMPKKAAKQKEIDPRSRFYPLGGNKFGGNIIYRYSDKEFRIERVFDRSKPKNDTFKLYCNGILDAQASETKESLGDKLFGLDEEGFEKIFFITGEDTQVRQNSSIASKLSQTIGLANDDMTPNDAIKILDDAAKEYVHLRGKGGKISAKQEEIASLRTRLRDEKKNADMLDVFEKRYAEVKRELDRLSKQKESAVKRDLYLKDRERYEAILSEMSGLSSELERIEQKYGNNIPTQDDIYLLGRLSSEYDKNIIEDGAISFSAAKEEELKYLENVFSDGVPDESEITGIKTKINRKSELESELLRDEKGDRYRERDKTLKRRFDERIPGGEIISEMSEKADRLRKSRIELRELTEKNATENIAGGKKNNRKIFLAVLAAVSVLAALLCAALINAVTGIVLLLVSISFFAAMYFIEIGRQRKSDAAAEKENDLKVKDLTSKCSRIEEEIRSFTVKYGYYSQSGVLSDLEMLRGDLTEYFELIQSERILDSERSEKRKTIESLSCGINLFFDKYQGYINTSFSLSDSLHKLLSDISRLRSLSAEREEYVLRKKQLTDKKTEIRSQITPILGKYGLIDDNTELGNILSHMKIDAYRADSLSSDIEAKREQSEKIAKSSSFTEFSDADIPDTDMLEGDISKCREELIHISDRIEDAENSLCEAELLEEKTDKALRELSVYEENYSILKIASEMLGKAYNDLHERYISPIKNVFSKYSELTRDILGQGFTFTEDMSVLVERHGEYMREEQLSSGERCIVLFCMRLALCENIFKNDMPFTILDDPFIALDKENFEKAASVLKRLSQDRQILYFCCHDSRNIR